VLRERQLIQEVVKPLSRPAMAALQFRPNCSRRPSEAVRRTSGHEGPDREKKYSSTLPLTSALYGVGGQRHAPVAEADSNTPVEEIPHLSRKTGCSLPYSQQFPLICILSQIILTSILASYSCKILKIIWHYGQPSIQKPLILTLAGPCIIIQFK